MFNREHQVSALRALWKYSFVPDVGPFRKKFVPGRWYATAGDAGLIKSLADELAGLKSLKGPVP